MDQREVNVRLLKAVQTLGEQVSILTADLGHTQRSLAVEQVLDELDEFEEGLKEGS